MERGKEPWLGHPSETIGILQKYDFVFRKQFGQNFLIDTHVLDKIVDAAAITKDDFVIEIGPGIGTLTQYLAYHAREVVAVEIDHDLIPILSDTLSAYDNVHVLNEDILKVDIRGMIEKYNGGKKAKVVANLPYYITTPIIMELLEKRIPVESITVMVQKWPCVCRQDRELRTMELCLWRCSIMQNLIWPQMYLRTVLCQGQRWAALLSG